ncbi:MAG: pyridoxamine 5'-phosphate oxidase [Vicinamibacterales bacterium]|nr:pyridoxamine 5'-phosphate oxidase [Vicinamibacterales bacterium]
MPETADPIALFKRWYKEAAASGALLPEAMALATASSAGAPSVRMVLYRGFSRGGFVFFTNYRSPKAADLVANPRAACVFHWPEGERQVRVEGRVEKVPRTESDRYFSSRPRESRLSAWASPQSSEIPDRAFLEREYARLAALFSGKRVPRPPFWGGFRVIPDSIEFWQGQRFRLHDRTFYVKKGRGWKISKLAP